MPNITVNVPPKPAVVTIQVPGAQGPASNLTIGTITTGAPGSAAAASITGTAPNFVLSLTIPQGVAGPAAPDATATVKGIAKLAGDLGGTADLPTVVSGANHTHTSAQVSDAASAATASKVVIRDSAGRAQVADPSANADIATKSYVDKGRGYVNVKAYGALVDGSTNDATAVAAAITALGSAGGTVFVPAGTMVIGSTITVPSGIRIVGAGKGATTIKRSFSGILFDISGTATSPFGSRVHYSGIEDVKLDANGTTGNLIRAQYADHLNFNRVWSYNCPDTAFLATELWDSYFVGCEWDLCGTNTFRTGAVVRLLGSATDSTNEIYFSQCRWEGFAGHAVYIDSNSTGHAPYGIWFSQCKMETPFCNGNSFLAVTNDVTDVHVRDLYLAADNLASGGSAINGLIYMIASANMTIDGVHAWVNNSAASAVIYLWPGNVGHSIRSVYVDAPTLPANGIINIQGGTPSMRITNVGYKAGQAGTVFGGIAIPSTIIVDDNMTSAATAYAPMIRDSAGRASVADPSASTDIATKNYTDTQITAGRRASTVVKTTSYTLALGDERTVIQMNSATTVGVTIPANASVAFPIGTVIEVEMTGAGTVNLVPGSGAVTLSGYSATYSMTFQYSMVTMVKVGTDAWILKNWMETNATQAATASTLVFRDGAGRAQVATPSAAADITTKNYVDTKTWTSSQISDATSANTASKVVIRDASARAQFADPSAAQDAATKNYTDTQDAAMRRPVLNTQTASYTLVLTDERKLVQLNSVSATTLTVPLNSSVAFPVGSIIDVQMIGTGNVTISGAGGVTVNSPDSVSLMTRQYAVVRLQKTATDSWNLTHISAAAATSASTANTVVKRDSAGRASVADPSASTDIATKNYTDTQVATKAAIAGDLGGTAAAPTVTGGTHHTHTSSQISDATSSATASTIPIRDTNGAFHVNSLAIDGTAPSFANEATRKDYVDGKTWAATAITNTAATLTDAATIATDASTGRLFRVSITASRTMGAPTNAADGMRIMYEVTASGGAWTLTMATGTGGFVFGTDFTSIPTIASGTTSYIGCLYSSRDSKWHVLAVGSGF